MNFGLKKVYVLFFVRNPKSKARLKSDNALLMKPAWRASSLLRRVKISATTGLLSLRRRPNSLYNKNPENSAVHDLSKNSMKIFLVGPEILSAAALKVSLRTKWVWL